MSPNDIDASDLSPESAPDVVYRRFLDEGVLAYQQCADCGKAVFPPRVLCPYCGHTSLAWLRSRAEGQVYSVTTLYPRNKAPYHVALIDASEGFRMMSNVVGAEEVPIGSRVRINVEAAEDGTVLPISTLET